jgi:membrane-bound lytic murein transglycosylase B
MKNIFNKIVILLIFMSVPLLAYTKNYTENKEVRVFINDLVKNDNFNKKTLYKLFSKVDLQRSALKYYLKPNPNSKKRRYKGSWDRYEKKLLNDRRVKLGASFMKRNRKALAKAYRIYGVQPEYITAIIGVESYYGEYTGTYPVFDALTTLAFEENRRNEFFKSELKAFLKLSKRNKENPKTKLGSFAGAMGLAQFMPSNFKKLAIDFNNDGKVDLDNEVDAIGSIANYFRKSGWNKKIPVATRVSYQGKRFTRLKTGFKYKYKRSRLKGIKPKNKNFFYSRKVYLVKLDRYRHDELWYGTKNFYVITRYNRSSYYAMAVYQLAQKIKKEYKKV